MPAPAPRAFINRRAVVVPWFLGHSFVTTANIFPGTPESETLRGRRLSYTRRPRAVSMSTPSLCSFDVSCGGLAGAAVADPWHLYRSILLIGLVSESNPPAAGPGCHENHRAHASMRSLVVVSADAGACETRFLSRVDGVLGCGRELACKTL